MNSWVDGFNDCFVEVGKDEIFSLDFYGECC
jgi:hypothetical protein